MRTWLRIALGLAGLAVSTGCTVTTQRWSVAIEQGPMLTDCGAATDIPVNGAGSPGSCATAVPAAQSLLATLLNTPNCMGPACPAGFIMVQGVPSCTPDPYTLANGHTAIRYQVSLTWTCVEFHVDWPQFHNDPARQGYNPYETVLSTSSVASPGMGVLWTGLTSAPLGSPVVANGVVYVGSGGVLYAFAAGCNSGGGACTPLWTAPIAPGPGSYAPAVANGVVYIVENGSGNLYAFDANGITGCTGVSPSKTCQPLWTASGFWAEHPSSPVVIGGRVYVTSSRNLAALDAAGQPAYCGGSSALGRTCQPLWTTNLINYVMSGPAVANGRVYIGSWGGLFAFDAAGGTNCSGSFPSRICSPLWTDAVNGWTASFSVTIANGVVYVGALNDILYAFDEAGVTGCSGVSPTKTCQPLWVGPPTGGSGSFPAPAVANGKVYVGSGGTMYVFDAAGPPASCSGSSALGRTCQPLWMAAVGSVVSYSSPAVANGVVYIGSLDGKLYAFDAAGIIGCNGVFPGRTCTPLWGGLTGAQITSSPAVANGVVYVGSYDGKLYAFGTP